MNDKVAIIFVLVGIVLWLFIGIIIVKRKIRKILLSINFNFNCVCDKCGEEFVRQTEYIQKNFFEKAKRKTSSYRSENDIVITPVYEKYAREIECPNCKEKIFLYGEGTTNKLVSSLGIELLAKLPINPLK